MLKLTKKQLKQLAIALNANVVGYTPNDAQGSRTIAYSWNEANGFTTGLIFFDADGYICCTDGVK